MKRSFWIASLLAIMAVALPDRVSAQTSASLRLYEQHCATCHGNPSGPKNAPDGMQLRKLSSDAVYAAISKLPVHSSVQSLSDDDKRFIAYYLGGRKVGVADLADAKRMTNQCAANKPLDLSSSASWNGWGVDPENSRFQPAKAAGLTPDQIPQLKLKWAFGFPAVEEVYGQPTVAGGRVFIGVDSGAVYSIDAESGCVYWSFQADAGVRNAISISPAKGTAKLAAYFGDVKANLYKVDAATGKLVWKVKVDDNSLARITGAPTLYSNRLYVPVASAEERAAGMSAVHPCCTFRGSVVAVNADTGKQIWKTYVIADPPKIIGKNPNGVPRWGPAGGGVWNSPTIDPKNHALYVGTGDAYTEPAPPTTDALMAINLDTGKVLWSVQDTENDAWLSGCGGGGAQNNQNLSPNCPKELGPDFDFGSSPILRTLPNGHRILVAGQKSGMVWAHDVDNKGAVVWKAQLVDKLALGMITFGGAADDQRAYFGLRTGGVAAIDFATGEKKWFTPEDDAHSSIQLHGQTAAVTAIPGVLFSGGWDGVLRAYSTDNGRLLWEYDTAHDFTTVNGVAARGGSMGAPGPVVAGGMLFAGSGYVFGAGTPGNVLLAFGAN
jgi:polyvinyl alcohol dehydrogenase (cytochrome)